MSEVLNDVFKETPDFVKIVGELRTDKSADSEVPTEQLDAVAAKATERLERALRRRARRFPPEVGERIC